MLNLERKGLQVEFDDRTVSVCWVKQHLKGSRTGMSCLSVFYCTSIAGTFLSRSAYSVNRDRLGQWKLNLDIVIQI
jgi:hypothetical protein